MKRPAIVTGGAQGIGLAITRALLEEGFSVAVLGRSPRDEKADFMRLASAYGEDCRYVQGDLNCPGARNALLEAALSWTGRLDLLVNNAGIAPGVRRDLLEMTEESYDQVLSANLKGNMFLTQMAAKQMVSQAHQNGLRGVIVNISSISATHISLNRGEYCISKAGVSMLTKLYAERLAHEDILVYEVRPGIIDTALVSAEARQKYDGMLARGAFPIARWGLPQDVAKAVMVLAEGRLRYTTGQVLHVDGGFHINRL